MQETILQHWLITKFALPFLLIFVVIFAILEKTNILGEGKHQVNALVAFVIGLIFVSVAYPKEIVNNLILFLTVAIIVVFVGLLIWGFFVGSNMKENIFSGRMKWIIFAVVVFAMIIAVLYSAGIQNTTFDLLFHQSWSESFWTNFLFIVVIAVALAAILFGARAQTSG